MKVTIKIEKEVEITILQLKAGVRYWVAGWQAIETNVRS